MADVSIRGVTYTGVAKLDLDKSGGGSAIYYDTEDADAVAADILTGKKAYGASGLITGTRQPPSGSISITDNGSVDVTDYATALVNVQGGGGGPTASDAILTVTVPSGSTVTATKGGVTLTPTMWVQAADNALDCALFVIAPAQFDATTPWTVTATRGTETVSDTVTIDSNKQYDVELTYTKWLYKDGFTSNYPQEVWYKYINTNGALIVQSDCIEFAGSALDYGEQTYAPNEKVDLSAYKTIIADCRGIKRYNNDRAPRIFVGGELSAYSYSHNVARIIFTSDSVKKRYYLDIQNLNGEYYIGMAGCGQSIMYTLGLSKEVLS